MTDAFKILSQALDEAITDVEEQNLERQIITKEIDVPKEEIPKSQAG